MAGSRSSGDGFRPRPSPRSGARHDGGGGRPRSFPSGPPPLAAAGRRVLSGAPAEPARLLVSSAQALTTPPPPLAAAGRRVLNGAPAKPARLSNVVSASADDAARRWPSVRFRPRKGGRQWLRGLESTGSG